MKKRFNKIYCPVLNKHLTTTTVLSLFSLSLSKDKKSILIQYSNKFINGVNSKLIVKSIDYGTINVKPTRFFYPLINKFIKTFLITDL